MYCYAYYMLNDPMLFSHNVERNPFQKDFCKLNKFFNKFNFVVLIP